MKIIIIMGDEVRENQHKEWGNRGHMYVSPEQLAKRVLAIHAGARALEDPKPAGRTSMPPPCARLSEVWGGLKCLK